MSEKNENPTKPKETKPKTPKAVTVETPVVEVPKVETPVEKLASDAIEKENQLEKLVLPGAQEGFLENDLDNPANASAPDKTLEKLKAAAPKKEKDEFVGKEEPLVFAKKLIESEKKHYDTIVKANKETISSLRKQVIETRDLLEAANKELETLKAATK